MNGFLVFSDLHAHNFKYGAKRVAAPECLRDRYTGVYNSRLVDTINVLDEIHRYANENDIWYVVFGGDLFHRRASLSVDCYTLIHAKLMDIANDGIELTLIPGNHDYADRSGKVHSLQAIDHKNVKICDAPNDVSHVGDSVFIYTVPYTDDLEEARDRLQTAGTMADAMQGKDRRLGFDILVAHLGMQGAKVGSDYVLVSDQDISVSDVPQDKFDLCLFGHFHQHQQLFKNGWFIGATHQHNWGDAGGKRGFLHVSTKPTVSFKHIEVAAAPKFVVQEADAVHEVREQDFCRVYHLAPLPEVVDKIKKDRGNGHLEVIQKTIELEDITLVLPEHKLNVEDAIEEYVNTFPTSISKELVKNEGIRLLREAKQDE